ncbi:MAG TPA: universal stress protein [Kofleriaceae bacterium]|nr:universal stress protein [Kofleriaceae bacterium]
MNWKTILVPHDFSSSANHAAAIARDEAKAHGSKLLLLHVIQLPGQLQPDVAIIPEPTGAPISMREYAVKQAEAHLEDLAARLAKDGVNAQTFLRIGNPVDEILTFVVENHVDLIVMGTHGRSGVAKMLAGSVTERVVRASTVPVLTTRHPE